MTGFSRKLKYYLGLRSLKNKRLVMRRLFAKFFDVKVRKAKVYILWADIPGGYEGIGWSYYEDKLNDQAKKHFKEYHIEPKYYSNAGLRACTKTLREFN